MFGNLFTLLFCALLVWLLYRFKLQRGVPVPERRWLLLILGFLALVLVINTLFAWLGVSSLRWLTTARLYASSRDLETAPPEEPRIIKGRISDAHERAYYEYVAYIDERGWRQLPWELWIEVGDGKCQLVNKDFEARNWHWDSLNNASFLRAGDEVIVVGKREPEQRASTETTADKRLRLYAVILFVGDSQDFTASARWKMIPAIVLLIANLTGIVAIASVIWQSRLVAKPLTQS